MTKDEAIKKLVNAGMGVDEAIDEVNEISGAGMDLENQVNLAAQMLKNQPEAITVVIENGVWIEEHTS
jgi:hypothetical protein